MIVLSEDAVKKQKLEENMLHRVVPCEDSLMECGTLEIPEGTNHKSMSRDATTQTRYYKQCLVKLQDCKMCLQTYNESEVSILFINITCCAVEGL